MIYFITGRQREYNLKELKSNGISISNMPHFLNFVTGETSFQLDVETSMTKDGPMAHKLRKLYVVQIGLLTKKVQFVFDIPNLDLADLSLLKSFLINTDHKYLGHNIRFEYLVLKAQLGIEIEELHDTYLLSKILSMGIDRPTGFHSLAGCVRTHLNLDMDKESQTTFVGDPLTVKQIKYAAFDVEPLYELFAILYRLLKIERLVDVYDIEREVLKAFSDMELNPMNFDLEYWKDVAAQMTQKATNLENELIDLVKSDVK